MSTPVDHVTIIERLARVEEKLDHALTFMIDNRSRLDAHDGRIRSLENQGSRLMGMGALVATVAGLFGSQIAERIIG
jgi:hypothetical protein